MKGTKVISDAEHELGRLYKGDPELSAHVWILKGLATFILTCLYPMIPLATIMASQVLVIRFLATVTRDGEFACKQGTRTSCLLSTLGYDFRSD